MFFNNAMVHWNCSSAFAADGYEWSGLQLEKFRLHFSRCLSSVIVRVSVVLKRTRRDSDSRLDNLSGSHFQSQSDIVSSLDGIYSSCSVIVRVSVVLKRTVGDSHWRFDNLSGRHLQSHCDIVPSVDGIYVSGYWPDSSIKLLC